MDIPKDFLDVDLRVGDEVVFIEPEYRNFKTGLILRIGSAKATIVYNEGRKTTYRLFKDLIFKGRGKTYDGNLS